MSRVVHTNIWSAYGYARKAGYEGTEEEFEQGLKKSAEAAGNAEESAYTASEAATEAAAARDAAAQSAESASTSEGNALEYANSAAQVLRDAQAVAQTVNAKATEAAGSASRAENYAQTATTKASEAATAAGTATTAATSASGSAQAADASATAAAASETNAAASASSASTSAGSASESADDAAESAAAAQAVKDSIPADYSQLSADVTDLKSDIIKKSYYNYKLDLVWTSGYRIAPNGTVATSTQSSATLDYYPVEKDDTIIAYVHSPGAANVVAVYDINKNFIESFTVANSFAPKKYAITQNGFIRFSNEFGVISAPYAYIERAYKTNDELENEINQSKTDTAKNTGKMPLVWTDGCRIGTDGGFYSNSTSEATKDYYQVTKDQIIILNLFASGVANVALYNEQLEFVSRFNVTTVGETYIVPQNGYMRFSNEKVLVAEPFVKIFSNYLSVEEIEEKLTEIETDTNKIPYIENSIDDIYEKIGETPGSKEYTHTISGIVLRLPSNVKDVTITPSTGVVITGHNLLNTAQYKANKILNDSGTEVSDGSSFYFDSPIPIKNVSRIFTTVPIQRFYYFDQNMQWLGRSGVYSENVTSRAIPLISNLAYIKIQSSYSLFPGNPETAVVSLDGNLKYTPYQTNTVGMVYEEGGVAYSNSFDSIEIIYTDSRPLCFPDFWQPNSADSGYSMPIALNQALRSNWTATDKYHYYDFLAAKFDRYIGKYANGYSVTKRFLGQDSKKTGYEIAEYTFSPAYPEHTLLLSSAMNSNEIVTVWGVARLIESLMDEDNLILKAIKDTTKIIIVPFICPSSFDTEPMYYYNANGVRINKNFNYITSWSQITGDNNPKGDYPDSEIETQILKEWVNSYAYKADLWIDCHSDHTPMSSNRHRVCYVFASDNETLALSNIAEQRIKDYYVSAGTADALTDQVFSAIEPGNVYPKTLYGYYMCGIPSIMLEQTIGTTIFGSNGSTINDIPGIKNYTAMLYMLINTLLSK